MYKDRHAKLRTGDYEENVIAGQIDDKFIQYLEAHGLYGNILSKASTQQDKKKLLTQVFTKAHKAKMIRDSKEEDTKLTYDFGGNKVFTMMPEAAWSKMVKNLKGHQLYGAHTSRLSKWNDIFRQLDQEDLTTPEGRRAVQAARDEYPRLTSQIITTDKNSLGRPVVDEDSYQHLYNALNTDPANSTMLKKPPEHKPLMPSEAKEGRITYVKPDIKNPSMQTTKRTLDTLTPASKVLITSKVDNLDVEYYVDDPADPSLADPALRKAAEGRQLLSEWRKDRYRPGKSLDNLVEFTATKLGSANGNEVTDIADAVLFLEPDNSVIRKTTPNIGRRPTSKQNKLPNPVYDNGGRNRGKITDIKSKAEAQRAVSQEAWTMIDQLQQIVNYVEGVEGQSLGAGASAEMVIADVKTAGVSLIEVAKRTFGQGVAGISKSLKKVLGSEHDINTLKQMGIERATSSTNAAESDTFLSERNGVTTYYEGLAKQAFDKIDQDMANKVITERVAGLRKLIIMKKMALTYRLSGLFQGDSSGRTISNQDYDIAASSLWGELYAFTPKMEDLKQFFNSRIKRFNSTLEYLDDDASFLASKITDAVLRRDSREHIKRLIGENQAGMAASKAKPEDSSAFLRSMVNDMVPHMEDSPFGVTNTGDLIKKISTAFTTMRQRQQAPLKDLRTLLSESSTLPAARATIDLRNSIVTILEKTYPSDAFTKK